MSRILGHVDSLGRGGVVSGWAIDENSQNPCLVRVLRADGTEIASGLAERERSDLRSLGYNRVNFSFQIPISLPINSDRLHVLVEQTELISSPINLGDGNFEGYISVSNGVVTGRLTEVTIGKSNPAIRVEDQIGRVVAQTFAMSPEARESGQPRVFQFSLPLRMDCFGVEELSLSAYVNGAFLGRAAASARLRGHLDMIGPGRVAGWLHSQDAISRHMEIEVYADGVRAGGGTCNRPRHDLKEKFPESWQSGFDIALISREGTDAPKSISIKLTGSSQDLFEGPFVLAERTDAIHAAREMFARLRNDRNVSSLDKLVFEQAFEEFFQKRRSAPAAGYVRLASGRQSLATLRRFNIIVPICGESELAPGCIESVIGTRDAERDAVILVNDPSPGVNSWLNNYLRLPNVFILHNERPLGHEQSVNRGIRFCPGGHCVILTPKIKVYFGIWNELEIIIQKSHVIGTITPLSNNARSFSYPHPTLEQREPLEDVSWEDLAAEALAQSHGRIGAVPAGLGSCLLLRRELLDQLGEASVHFSQETAEENLCQRAADLGWRNVAAFGVLVENRERASSLAGRGRSTPGKQREAMTRYPEYAEIEEKFERLDPLRVARWPLDRFRLRKMRESGSAFALVIRHWLGGGTEVAIRDLERAHGYGDRIRLTLTFCKDGRRELSCERLNLLADFPPEDNSELFAMLDAARVDFVAVHQLLGGDEGFVSDLVRWVRLRGDVRMVFHVHDFYALCQRVTMFDAAGRFCAVSEDDVCKRCVALAGAHEAHRMGLAPGREHQDCFAQFMAACSEVVTPSEDTMRWMQRVFPNQRMVVRAHPDEGTIASRHPRRGDPNQVILLGAISREKGSHRLLELAREARLNCPDIHFHVVGYTQIDDKLREIGNVSITGTYEREELPDIINKINGIAVLFLHEWPETFSYTLSEAWSLGLWPLVPDLGAPAERVRARGVGKVLKVISAQILAEELAGLT